MQIRKFFTFEKAAGVIMLISMALALIAANSPLAGLYQAIHHSPIHIRVGGLIFEGTLVHWINQGLMVIFFVLVGFEIKRQMIEGHLSTAKSAALPAISALGGMLVPAIIYVGLNIGDAAAIKGWAVPTATDIVLALSILSLLGPRVPVGLKVFLTALAIFDDIGAVVIIGIFYGEHFALAPVLIAATAVGGLGLLNRARICHPAAYVAVGTVLWLAMMKSGLEAALAGVVIAFFVPMYTECHSPLRTAEKALHPWSVLLVVPAFVFINSGISIDGRAVLDFSNGVWTGTVFGLLVGKQLGVFGAAWLAVKTGISELPRGVTWRHVYGASLLAGIGFTMSLFIASRAFPDPTVLATAKLAILIGSLLSALGGILVIRRCLGHSEAPDCRDIARAFDAKEA